MWWCRWFWWQARWCQCSYGGGDKSRGFCKVRSTVCDCDSDFVVGKVAPVVVRVVLIW